MCDCEERLDVFKELDNGTLIFFVGFCFGGVSSEHLCASVHLHVKHCVHVGSYLYHLFTFPYLYLVAVSHLSPPLFCPTSHPFWLYRMPHSLLTQAQYEGFNFPTSQREIRKCLYKFPDFVPCLFLSFPSSHLLVLSFPHHPRHIACGRQK